MNHYTQLCVASSAVSFGTISLLLWNASGRSDMSYIYLSLAAPTVILGHHLLYFFTPFFDLDSASYTVVPQAPATPTSQRRSGADNSRPERPKLFINTSVSTTSEERNPMVSSTLSILCLILLTVLVGAIAVSAGTVAFLTTTEEASIENAVERLDMFAAYYNTTTAELKAGVNIGNATVKPEFASTALKMSHKILSQIFADVAEISGSPEAGDPTTPPPQILAAQAVLSLTQMLLLGSIVVIGMRRRVSRYACDHDEEDDYDFNWTYVEDNTDSTDGNEEVLEDQVIEYVSRRMHP